MREKGPIMPGGAGMGAAASAAALRRIQSPGSAHWPRPVRCACWLPCLQGTLRTYARMTGPCDPPAAIGLEMSAGLQDDLPGPTEVNSCFEAGG